MGEGLQVVARLPRAQRGVRAAVGLLAGLGDPVLPRVLTSGQDEQGERLVMPFHSGPACGLVGTAPLEVFATLGHLHAEFVGLDLPVEFERLDERFVISGLRDLGRRAWDEARELVGERVWQQGATLTEQMLDDSRFRSLGSAWR